MTRASYWQDMTTRDFADPSAAEWIAVLPIAAIEQHGPHLPLSTDTVIAEGLVKRCVAALPADLPAIFLPVQAIGNSDEHLDHVGTLTLSWELAVKAWTRIGEGVHRAGLRKLVIVTSHGGNVQAMDLVTRELRLAFGMLAVATSWNRMGLPEGLISQQERSFGIHGGEVETAMMLALAPDLVRKDQAQNFHSAQHDLANTYQHLRAYGPSQFGWKAADLNPQGAVGNAASARAETGNRILDFQAAGFLTLLREIHDFDLTRLQDAAT